MMSLKLRSTGLSSPIDKDRKFLQRGQRHLEEAYIGVYGGSRRGDVLLAPKAELQAHKAAFRELFGDTLSDEFVDEMLTQLDSVLAPGPWDV